MRPALSGKRKEGRREILMLSLDNRVIFSIPQLCNGFSSVPIPVEGVVGNCTWLTRNTSHLGS